jgi:hypothetical protein
MRYSKTDKYYISRGWTYECVLLALAYMKKLRDAGVTHNKVHREIMFRIDGANNARKGHYSGAKGFNKSTIDLWSAKALAAFKKDPTVKLRVEHGSPRTPFAQRIFNLYLRDKLTEKLFNKMLDEHYKLAVITLEEDKRISANGHRSVMHDTPDMRWKAAGIKIVDKRAIPKVKVKVKVKASTVQTQTLPRSSASAL